MRSRVLISILAWLGYLAHTGLTLWAAWSSQWPLPIPKYLASPVGLLLVPAGALLYLTAVVSFRSLGWAIAHSSKQLVTNGIYRYCRHPQYAGWELVLLGVSIAGRSGLALLLSLALLAFFAALVPVEERSLEREFGAHYREYRANTRWVRWPLGRWGRR